MTGIKPCECLAMLIADKVIREEKTHKVYILGTFNSIFSHKYPTVHDTMHVYLALTDATQGQHAAKLQLVYIDGDEELKDTELLSTEGKLVFSDKLQVLEFNMAFRQVKFPRPGALEFRFYLDGSFIAARSFRAVQKERPEQPPPAAPE